MSLLRELYEEMSVGATSGGDVAAFAEPLLAKPRKRLKIGNFYKIHKPKISKRRKIKETFNYGDFDASSVMSKLDAAETKSKYQSDTVTFGLEDEKGNVVRVIVDANQSKEFESVLARMLGDQHDDTVENYNGTPAKEIAEILFQLKSQFNIVDVKWGDLPVDEEEEPEASPSDEGDDMEASGQESGEDAPETDDPNMPTDVDMGGEVPNASQGSSPDEVSLLQKVIDMMKTDAEARIADAEARSAEAKATVSKYASDAALAKVKQEEDVLDMETYYKDKQTQDKEAKTLAKLAKYKHDVASEDGVGLNSSSEEEETVTLNKLSDLIIQRLKGRR